MEAGRLDRRVDLQRRSLAAPNAHGEQVQSWATYATVWAQKLEGGGRETFIAQTTYAATDKRFRIRHRTDVLTTDRLVCEGVSFDIIGVAEIGRREGLELFVRGQA